MAFPESIYNDDGTAFQVQPPGAAKNSRMRPHMQNGDDLYDLVTVSDARQKGILPLPWH